jgi:hypothetical protein
MKLRISFLAVFSLFLFAACDKTVETPNGIVPDAWLPALQIFTGSYSGTMEKTATNLSLTLQGNKPVLNASADLLGPSCDSAIGELESISVDEKAHTLSGMTFALDPGNCARIEGRTVNLIFSFAKDGSIADLAVNILYRSDSDSICTPGHNGIDQCRPNLTYQYYSGSFKKN